MPGPALVDAWCRLGESPGSQQRLDLFERCAMLDASGLDPSASWVSRWRMPELEHTGLRVSSHARRSALAHGASGTDALVVVEDRDGVGVWGSRHDGRFDHLLVSPAEARLDRVSFAVAPGGSTAQVATAHGTDGVRLWDLDHLSTIGQLRGHDAVVCAGLSSPDGDWLATGDDAGGYDVYDAVTLWHREPTSEEFRPAYRLDGPQHDLVVWDVRLSTGSSGELLALVCGPTGAAIWRPSDGVVRRVPGTSGRIGRLVDGRVVAATVTESSNEYRELSGAVHIGGTTASGDRIVQLPHPRGVTGIEFVAAAGAVLLAVGCTTGRVSLWDPGACEKVDELELGERPQALVSIPGPEDRPFCLGVGGSGGAVLLWGPAGSRRIRVEGGVSRLSAARGRTGELLLVEARGQGDDAAGSELRLFSLRALVPGRRAPTEVRSVAAVDGRDAIAMVSATGRLVFRRASSGVMLPMSEAGQVLGPEARVFPVVGGSSAAFASADATRVDLWSAEGEWLDSFLHDDRPVEAVVSTRDGAIGVLWRPGPAAVQLWRPSSDVQGPQLPGEFAAVSAGVLATEFDGLVRLFDLELGTPVGTPLPGRHPELGVIDGHQVVARYHDDALHVTRVADGRPVVRPIRNLGEVHWIAIDDDEVRGPFVSVGSDQRLVVLGRLPDVGDDRLRCVGGAVIEHRLSRALSLGPVAGGALRFLVHVAGRIQVLDVTLGHRPLHALTLSASGPSTPYRRTTPWPRAGGAERTEIAASGSTPIERLVIASPEEWLAEEGVPGFRTGPARFAVSFSLRTPLVRVPDDGEHDLRHLRENIYAFRGRIRYDGGAGMILDGTIPLVNCRYGPVGSTGGMFEAEVALFLGEETLVFLEEHRSWNIEEIHQGARLVCAPITG